MDGKRFFFRLAASEDAPRLAELHTSVANHLTSLHGKGPWSSRISEKGVLFAMRHARVFVGTEGRVIIATFTIATKKPWAIDTKYFSKCKKALYLLSMAVAPTRQRQGLGRKCLEEATSIAKAWPADAIRLDAYDGKGGGGPFYQHCGFVERGRVIYRKTALIYYERLLPAA